MKVSVLRFPFLSPSASQTGDDNRIEQKAPRSWMEQTNYSGQSEDSRIRRGTNV